MKFNKKYFAKSNRWTGSGALTLLPPYLTANIASESISKSNATPINEIDLLVSLRTDLILIRTLTFLFWLEGTIKQGNMTSEGIDISPLTLQASIRAAVTFSPRGGRSAIFEALGSLSYEAPQGFEASSRDTSLLSQLATSSCRWSTWRTTQEGVAVVALPAMQPRALLEKKWRSHCSAGTHPQWTIRCSLTLSSNTAPQPAKWFPKAASV